MFKSGSVDNLFSVYFTYYDIASKCMMQSITLLCISVSGVEEFLQSMYRSSAIITGGLYIFNHFMKSKNVFFFQGAFFLKFWSYVWFIFKSRFKSSAGYDGAHTVLRL